MNEPTLADRTVAAARGWMGVRWQHQGRSARGVDCAGLVIEVAREVHGTTLQVTGYAQAPTDETMLRLCREHLVLVDAATLQPGDVLVLGFGKQRHMGFVGNYVYGGLSLIHAYMPSRKVVEVRLDETWRGRIVGAFRFPGVA